MKCDRKAISSTWILSDLTVSKPYPSEYPYLSMEHAPQYARKFHVIA